MRSPHRWFPWYGWVGLAGILSLEVLLENGSTFVATWFTPLMWTGYILFADACVAIRGDVSWLTSRRREAPLLVLLSVGVWLIFEAYNLHLRNWHYVNVPANAWVRILAFFWSFATIMPGVFETSDLLRSFLPRSGMRQGTGPLRPAVRPAIFAVGVAMVTIPLAVSEDIAAYLFAPVWVGFILLLEPILEQFGFGGALRDWRNGEWQTCVALLLGGFVCGLLWETWNYQAYLHQGAHWVYTIPEPLRVFGLHFGQMPILGLLGFPPFALELHAFYHTLKVCLGGAAIFGVGPQGTRLTTS